MLRALRSGEPVRDSAFDTLYPPAVRLLSQRFWTPVGIARRASQLFAELGVRRVLDVGSGAGKFCLVAGAVSSELSFHGVEQRESLVDSARALGARLGIANAHFSVGDVMEQCWSAFDGFYFFNPFGENIHPSEERIDSSVELSDERYEHEVELAEQRLAAAAVDSVVITYHGFGGRIPGAYELAVVERIGSDWLRVWVKRREHAEGHHLEIDGGSRRVVADPEAPR